MHVAVARGHPFAERDEIKPGELNGQDFIAGLNAYLVFYALTHLRDMLQNAS